MDTEGSISETGEIHASEEEEGLNLSKFMLEEELVSI